MNKPLISVLMTTCNEGKYIIESTRSILEQTFGDFEFIIVDDGSTDDTVQQLEAMAKQDERIVVIKREHTGRPQALNAGLDHTSGKYIAIMDAGDICLPSRFEREVKFMEENEDVSIVGTWAYWINEKKELLSEWRHPTTIDRCNMYRTGGAVHSSMLVRRELFEKIGGYDENYTSAIDYELCVRAIKNGAKIANIPEVLVHTLMRDSGICGRVKESEMNLTKVRLKYLPYFRNFWSFAFTILGFIGYLMPSFLGRKLQVFIITTKDAR